MTEHVAARDAALAQQAAEHRLVHGELLLDGQGRQADLPADLRDASGAAPVDEGELDAIRVVLLEAVAPRVWKVHAPLPRFPEFIDCPPERRLVHRHERTIGDGCGVPQAAPTLSRRAGAAYDSGHDDP